MGRPMAEALLNAGFPVRGFDIRPASDFDSFQTHMERDPQRFCAGVETLISVVRDVDQTEALLFEDQSILERAPDLDTLIISSTVSPRYIRALRDRIPERIALVDAPMSGAAIAAREARLSFMLGGDRTLLERLQPLFAAMGRDIHILGPLGSGMSAKVLNNLVAASSVATTRLALGWADEMGLAETDLLKVLHTSSGQTWFGSNFDDIEFARDGLSDANSIGIIAKDVRSAIDGSPPGADTTLAEALIVAIEKLIKRS